jgi:uncharacterized protein
MSDPESPMPSPMRPGPVSANERIAGLDTLRGVAVLGILFMNIYGFAMPFSAYSNPLMMGGTEPHNLGTWFVTHFLFDQKFMSIFSMLFGAGAVLMSGRAASRGVEFGPIYYRRMFWLLLLGALHGYLLWFGDILFAYAAIGMLVFPLRNARPQTMIIVACLMLPVALLLSYGNASYLEKTRADVAEIERLQEQGETLSDEQLEKLEDWPDTRAFLAPTEEDVQRDVDAYLGDYLGIVTFRAKDVAFIQLVGIPYFGIWRIGGLMLLGMALMRLSVFSGGRSADFYQRLMLAGYSLGLPLTIFSGLDLYAHQFDTVYAFRYGNIANYFGSLFVAFGHVGLILLVVKTGFVPRLMRRFAAVGRMALTNYLLHSLILTSLFYGYGLGFYGQVPRFAQMGFVVAVIALQLYLSPWWLARFRFGPFEWLWRSLTYWQLQPMRSRNAA